MSNDPSEKQPHAPPPEGSPTAQARPEPPEEEFPSDLDWQLRAHPVIEKKPAPAEEAVAGKKEMPAAATARPAAPTPPKPPAAPPPAAPGATAQKPEGPGAAPPKPVPPAPATPPPPPPADNTAAPAPGKKTRPPLTRRGAEGPPPLPGLRPPPLRLRSLPQPCLQRPRLGRPKKRRPSLSPSTMNW